MYFQMKRNVRSMISLVLMVFSRQEMLVTLQTMLISVIFSNRSLEAVMVLRIVKLAQKT